MRAVRGEQRFFRWILGLLCLLFLLGTAGCGSQTGEAGLEEEKGYTLPEIMAIAATERNRYESVYTEQIWAVEVDSSGDTIEDMLLEQIRTFLEDLETMNQLAQSRGIQLSASETDSLYRLAAEYYGSLTEGDLAYMGISQDEVRTLYERYYLANKLVNELTKDTDLEISDSEAKVIDIQQIVLDSQAEAETAYSLAAAEGADFAAIAKEYSSGGETELSLGRGEADSAYEEAAFSLEEGEISRIIESEGKYYIIKCINPYNEEETLRRKNQLSLDRKEQAFRAIYDEFKAENPVEIPDSLWSQVSFDGGEDCRTTNFFDLYQEYFPD